MTPSPPEARPHSEDVIEMAAYDEAMQRALAAEAELRELQEALDAGKRFERAYQESLGATPTTAQWERLESLQSRFIDLYVPLLAASSEEPG